MADTYEITTPGNNIGVGTSTSSRVLTVSSSSSNTGSTSTSAAAVGIINTDTTDGNLAGLVFNTKDTNGALALGAKIDTVFTSHTPGAVSGDITFVTKNVGTNTERMRIISNGNVGIGSVTPGVQLDVNGTARASFYLGNGSLLTGISGSGTVNSGTAGQVAFYPSSTTAVNGTSALFIDGSGNVGFGSAVPGSKLDVNGTARVFGNIGIGTASPGQAVDIIGSARLSNILSFTQGSQFVDQNGLAFSKALGTDSSSRNYFAITGTLHNAANATTTGLFVTASTGTAGTGNIFGISGRAIPAHTSGTNSNVYGLYGQNQINGSGGTTTNSFGVWGTTALMTAGTLKNDYAAGFFGPVVVTNGNVGIGTLIPTNNLDVQGTISATHFVVASSGNIGINSISPGQDLDVQGSVRANNLSVVGGAGSIGSVKTGINTVCTTTCGTSKCLLGEDTSVIGTIVGCSDATADICVCLGP